MPAVWCGLNPKVGLSFDTIVKSVRLGSLEPSMQGRFDQGLLRPIHF
ncbi:hypothetical protein Syncc8109_0089 [Synechococcus sp. WH 8109]|nr:hypothetical protein Syncc8109_0089 [Synechococcus sp. WH 8109]